MKKKGYLVNKTGTKKEWNWERIAVVFALCGVFWLIAYTSGNPGDSPLIKITYGLTAFNFLSIQLLRRRTDG